MADKKAVPVRAISMAAENVKRIKAVEIKFTDPMVQITGKNGQGKTSILDAFWWALGGKDGIQATPIRKGCEEAKITVDLGDIIVRRHFSSTEEGGYTSKVTVESAEGARFPSPQKMLDELYGQLTFDPLDFAQRPPAQQAEMLRALVPGYDFAKAEQENAKDAARRTEIGRARDVEKAAAASITVPDGTPDKPVDEESLASELEAAVEGNAVIEKRVAGRGIAKDRIVAIEKRAKEITEELAALTLEQQELQTRLEAAPPIPAPVDVEALRARHREARAANQAVTDKLKKARHIADFTALSDVYEGLTMAIENRKEDMDRAVAEADLPVPGLAFGVDHVMLNGIPFEQASDAERLRVSTAIAMALNPRLRVIRVRDGSLLDDDAVKLMADMAKDRGYLVICERVQPAKGVGLIVEIEDGSVKA